MFEIVWKNALRVNKQKKNRTHWKNIQKNVFDNLKWYMRYAFTCVWLNICSILIKDKWNAILKTYIHIKLAFCSYLAVCIQYMWKHNLIFIAHTHTISRFCICSIICYLLIVNLKHLKFLSQNKIPFSPFELHKCIVTSIIYKRIPAIWNYIFVVYKYLRTLFTYLLVSENISNYIYFLLCLFAIHYLDVSNVYMAVYRHHILIRSHILDNNRRLLIRNVRGNNST